MGSNCFLTCLVVFLLLCRFAEAKGWNRVRHSQRRLRELCRIQNKSKNSKGNAIELHAFFDLQPKNKTIACLKVSTCKGKPVCFVTSYPRLNAKAINDSTIWQDLITYIQKDRKIEPIYDNSMNGWSGHKYKVLSKYVRNQPTINRMCQNAMIYRFVANDNKNFTSSPAKNATNSTSSNNTSKITITTTPKLDPVSLCPLFATNKKGHRKFKTVRSKRVDRSKSNVTSSNFMLCQGLSCPCHRICFGQGRKQNSFTDCSTFRIICTFNCGHDAGILHSISTKPTKRKKKGGRKQKGGRKNRKRPRRKPRRKPKKSKKGNRKKKNGK